MKRVLNVTDHNLNAVEITALQKKYGLDIKIDRNTFSDDIINSFNDYDIVLINEYNAKQLIDLDLTCTTLTV